MPDFTGGLAPAITAFGSNVLPGIVNKLTAAGAADEAIALQSFHDDLTEALTAVKPFAEQVTRIADTLATFRNFSGGFDISVNPKNSAPKEATQ